MTEFHSVFRMIGSFTPNIPLIHYQCYQINGLPVQTPADNSSPTISLISWIPADNPCSKNSYIIEYHRLDFSYIFLFFVQNQMKTFHSSPFSTRYYLHRYAQTQALATFRVVLKYLPKMKHRRVHRLWIFLLPVVQQNESAVCVINVSEQQNNRRGV